ncbi:MAG: exo-alpha-sialidase [Candidatus Dormibacteraeota bacterium]|nr:exo-alpha-sialidase [Candidatus Dormibacteraeota bacterium]
MKQTVPKRWSLFAVAAMALTAALVAAPRAARADTPPVFGTAMLPPAPGLGLPHNEDGEPGIAIDGGGTIWIASDIAPYAADDPRATATGVLSGSDVWKSTDGGKTYQWVADPFAQLMTNQAGAGGEDTDIAANPVANSNGCYDIWVASLWIGSTSLAVSQDCGVTWTVVPVNGEPGQDRPWVAADGACTVYLSYHGLAPYNTFVDTFSLPPCTQEADASAVDPTETSLFIGNIAPNLSNRFGKLVVDTSPTSTHQHNVYEPMQGCIADSVTSNPESSASCSNNASILMGVSTNGGVTFTDSLVHLTNASTLYIWPTTAAVDSAGTVYIAWMEGDNGYAQRAYISHSTDGGQSWSTPVQINQPPSVSAAYPTLAATGTGQVEAAWYGTSQNGGTDDVTVMGEPHTTFTTGCGDGTSQPACTPADWQVWWATSTDFGETWNNQEAIVGTVHTGVLCVEGGGCGAYTDDRTMLDDFGLAIEPNTGGAVLTFNNDQPGGTAGKTHTDYATEVVPPSTSTPDLGHPLLGIGIAALVGGAVIFARRRLRPDVT